MLIKKNVSVCQLIYCHNQWFNCPLKVTNFPRSPTPQPRTTPYLLRELPRGWAQTNKSVACFKLILLSPSIGASVLLCSSLGAPAREPEVRPVDQRNQWQPGSEARHQARHWHDPVSGDVASEDTTLQHIRSQCLTPGGSPGFCWTSQMVPQLQGIKGYCKWVCLEKLSKCQLSE